MATHRGARFAVFCSAALLLLWMGYPATGAAQSSTLSGYNVLFIAVDDLRPELGCYDVPMIQSPHIDRLAEEGLLFRRAYCQQAVCSPSRTSLLTGRRPDNTQVYDLNTHFRDTIPDVVTLPEYFKANGYYVQALGKLYHGTLDDRQSWSVPLAKPKRPTYGSIETNALVDSLVADAAAAGVDVSVWANRPKGPPFEAPDIEDSGLVDGAIADSAVAVLQQIGDQPFFLAVGFIRPHLPFVAPKRYWDLYDRAALPLAGNPDAPLDAPASAMMNWGELRAYYGMPQTGPVTDDQARELVHGYYACTSYVDAQVGRLLDTLDQMNLRNSTIVILWGDHGWQLGEHGLWCKHTNFEVATHVPMIISVPGQQHAGVKTNALVEFVDIYPSLCDLAGLEKPDGLEGQSFESLLQDPDRSWKTAAFSQYPRNIPGHGKGMGYSMRTDRYRFTDWTVPDTDVHLYELYDHQLDPGENINLANQPEYADTIQVMIQLQESGWRAQQALVSPDIQTQVKSGWNGQQPEAMELDHNYPNPFNAGTTIRFRLPGTEYVRLNIFDMSGRHVRTLVNQSLNPGTHQFHWDGRNDSNVLAGSGIYIYQLSTPHLDRAKKLLLLR
jgi:iduronate 2-sulfatase